MTTRKSGSGWSGQTPATSMTSLISRRSLISSERRSNTWPESVPSRASSKSQPSYSAWEGFLHLDGFLIFSTFPILYLHKFATFVMETSAFRFCSRSGTRLKPWHERAVPSPNAWSRGPRRSSRPTRSVTSRTVCCRCWKARVIQTPSEANFSA